MKNFFFLSLVLISLSAAAQNDRLKDRNTITWPQLFITIPVNDKTEIVTEYQWRRTNGLSSWQQSLLRTAVLFKLNNQVTAGAGYAWVETFSYGDYPIASNGRFPEHRLFEQFQLKNNFRQLSVTQRLRIEQRWIGRKNAADAGVDEWLFSHRFRYLLRLQHPFTASGRTYVAMADEIFIGAGKNVGVNIFDQNRLMILLGIKANNHFALEAGYLSQTLVQGRRINNQTIVQDNRGFMFTLNVRL